MLQVDLGELARKKRVQIDESLPAEHPLFADLGFDVIGALDLHLEVQQAMQDVVALGSMEGEAEIACRRCLTPVRVPIEQELTLLYREGVSVAEAEAEEIYPLPEHGTRLDLSGALREHLILAVPQFVECQEACKGLCPHCGVNLNEKTCSCETSQTDDRWAALRKLARQD